MSFSPPHTHHHHHAPSPQHISGASAVEYFVSGGGAKRGELSPDQVHRAFPPTRFAVIDPGFTTHVISGGTMTTKFINNQGATLHEPGPRRVAPSRSSRGCRQGKRR